MLGYPPCTSIEYASVSSNKVTWTAGKQHDIWWSEHIINFRPRIKLFQCPVSSHNATHLCYFHVSWCCLWTQHKTPETRLWVSRHRARQIFSAHNEATISLFIVWLHFIFVHYVRSKTESNHGIIVWSSFKMF